ncbi:hypothetical protein HK101_007335, partial [Irineochytrium annulatum]
MFSFLLRLAAVGALASTSWPARDKPVPANSDWTRQYLSTASIPDIPVNKQMLPSPNFSGDYTSCNDPKSWALTFDDGPGPYTNALLDALDVAKVQVTFFVVGSRLAEDPAQIATLQRAYKAGHQIGIHTWSHSALTTLSSDVILAELIYTRDIIISAIGVAPRYMRPPYGDIDDRARAVIKTLGLEIVGWSRDTGDWQLSQYPGSPIRPDDVEKAVAKWIASPPKNGIISLQHDLWKLSAGEGEKVLPMVIKAGFNVVPVHQCIGGPSPYFEDATEPASTVTSTATVTTATGQVVGVSRPALTTLEATASSSSTTITVIVVPSTRVYPPATASPNIVHSSSAAAFGGVKVAAALRMHMPQLWVWLGVLCSVLGSAAADAWTPAGLMETCRADPWPSPPVHANPGNRAVAWEVPDAANVERVPPDDEPPPPRDTRALESAAKVEPEILLPTEGLDPVLANAVKEVFGGADADAGEKTLKYRLGAADPAGDLQDPSLATADLYPLEKEEELRESMPILMPPLGTEPTPSVQETRAVQTTSSNSSGANPSLESSVKAKAKEEQITLIPTVSKLLPEARVEEGLPSPTVHDEATFVANPVATTSAMTITASSESVPPTSVVHTYTVITGDVFEEKTTTTSSDTLHPPSSTPISTTSFQAPPTSNPTVASSPTQVQTTSAAATSTPARKEPPTPESLKKRFNHASFDCGALILGTNPGASSATSILVSSKDQYMLNQCSTRPRFVTVELCEAIMIDSIILANFEFFSSTFRDVRALVGERYPPSVEQPWIEVGKFVARNVRGMQVFVVDKPRIFSKYLRVEFDSHYGDEYYCPLTTLKVYGTTEMEAFKAEEEELARIQQMEQQAAVEEAVKMMAKEVDVGVHVWEA